MYKKHSYSAIFILKFEKSKIAKNKIKYLHDLQQQIIRKIEFEKKNFKNEWKIKTKIYLKTNKLKMKIYFVFHAFKLKKCSQKISKNIEKIQIEKKVEYEIEKILKKN